MLQTKFLSGGSNKSEALRHTCLFVSEIFLDNPDYPSVDKIDINCESANEAEELDQLLWSYPEDLLLPHSLTHKNQKKVFVEIGYPGSIFTVGDQKMLLNIDPDLPNQTSDYLFYYQLVVEDNGDLRRRAANTWKECVSMGLNPSFIET